MINTAATVKRIMICLTVFSSSFSTKNNAADRPKTGMQPGMSMNAGMRPGMNMNPGMQPDSGSWRCQCGAENVGRFCEYCGQPRPF